MKQRCDARNPFQSRLFWAAAEKRTDERGRGRRERERERASLSLWNGALSICFTTERASRHGTRNRYWVTKSTVHKGGESKI